MMMTPHVDTVIAFTIVSHVVNVNNNINFLSIYLITAVTGSGRRSGL